MKTQSSANGFTLLELLTVVALLGILSTIAIASLTRHIAEHRLENRIQSLAALFRDAQQEALRRRVPVVVCPVLIRTDLRASGSCNWQNAASGWRSFADLDSNGRYQENRPDQPIQTVVINSQNQISSSLHHQINDLDSTSNIFSGSFPVFLHDGSFHFIHPNDGRISHLSPTLILTLQDTTHKKIHRRIVIQRGAVILCDASKSVLPECQNH